VARSAAAPPTSAMAPTPASLMLPAPRPFLDRVRPEKRNREVRVPAFGLLFVAWFQAHYQISHL
jgi:hypothetical protein